MVELARQGNVEEIRRIFDAPYNHVLPSKLPAGKLIFHFASDEPVCSELDLASAQAHIRIGTQIQIDSILHAQHKVGLIRINAPETEFSYEIANPEYGRIGEESLGEETADSLNTASLKQLIYPAPVIVKEKDRRFFIQEINPEFSYGVFSMERKPGEFCKNSKSFVEWEFQLFGMEKAVSFKKLPELNSELKTILPEGFFYESNQYLTYEKICSEHGKNLDFQNPEGGSLSKLPSMETNILAYYQTIRDYLKSDKVTEYMNLMTWLDITICRDAKKHMLQRQESNDFLVQLSKCEKITEVDELFLQLFETIREKQDAAVAKKGVTGKLSEVKRYIEEHFRDQNLSLEGDEFSVSPNYLGRLFKKETGMSVADYINGERLKRVLKELEQTDRPAKEIAEECGFFSSNYFYTYFRKKIGLTPQAYREQCRESKIH